VKNKVKKSWLNGKNVIVTGAGSGIGKELALYLSSVYGCNVLAVGRREQPLKVLKQEIDGLIYLCADVSKKEEWQRIRDFTLSNNFKVDVVINNAGIIHPFKKLLYLTDEEIKRVIDTDYMAIIYSFKTFYPDLKKSKEGGFVTISSASAYLPVAGNTVYSSVKSASLAITEALRQEVYSDKIYVSAVMPGPVVTDLYEPDGEEDAKAGEDVSKVGLDAKKAGKRIAKKVSAKKSLINIDGVARFMKFIRKVAPAKTISLWGKLMRKANRPTFKRIFADEKVEKED